MITFEIPKELTDWVDKHCKRCHSKATMGEHFKYNIVPSALVTRYDVVCLVCSKSKTIFED